MENEEIKMETQQELVPCPDCQPQEPAAPVQTVADKVLPALKDAMFLAICILMSVTCLTSLSLGNLPLIDILATVFLWLTYAQAHKNIVDTKHLRCVSGTIYANYVIAYVAAGILFVCGIILAIALSFVMQDPDMMAGFRAAMMEADPSVALIAGFLMTGSVVLVLAIFILVAVVMILVNIFTTRYIHRFVKSVYESVNANTLTLKYATAAKVVLFIMSGYSAISALTALSSMVTAISAAASCATCLLAGLLIQKYFSGK